jgi:hypothetical protein
MRKHKKFEKKKNEKKEQKRKKGRKNKTYNKRKKDEKRVNKIKHSNIKPTGKESIKWYVESIKEKKGEQKNGWKKRDKKMKEKNKKWRKWKKQSGEDQQSLLIAINPVCVTPNVGKAEEKLNIWEIFYCCCSTGFCISSFREIQIICDTFLHLCDPSAWHFPIFNVTPPP